MSRRSGRACRKLFTPLGKKGPKSLELQSFHILAPGVLPVNMGTRVEDYLNDKIQTAADLDQVDALVQRVQEQQNLLRQQV